MKTNTQTNKKASLVIGFLFMTILGYAQTTQSFSTSSTFKVPAGVTTVQVEAWGGGGRGGSRTSGNNGYGGGGGGAYAKKAVTVSATNPAYTVTVGTGSTTTASGLDSWFSSTGTIIAKGGSSVPDNTSTGAAGGSQSLSIGDIVFGGGDGANGSSGSYGGGGGSSAGKTLTGTTATNATGATAPTGGGNGGNGQSGSTGNGSAGSVPGGGGGGSLRSGGSNTTGGNGASGMVTITWTCAGYSLSSTAANATCAGSNTTVTLSAGASALPIGNYTVTYNQSSPNSATGSTATMAVTTPGTGSFTTATLSNSGATTITITKLESGGTFPYNCSSNITTNNTTTVTVNPIATAVAGSTVVTCAVDGPVNITAGSSATNYTSVTWTSSGTGTFTNPNSLTLCTYEPSAADMVAGSVTLTLTSVNAPCVNVTSNKTLTVVPMPLVNAGNAIASCPGAGAVNITTGATVTNYSSVLWSASGTGTLTNSTSLTTCTYTPSAADIANGNVTVVLTANGITPCSVEYSAKSLTFTTPVANAGNAISTCSTSGAVNITSGASAANYASVLWTSSGTGTFTNATSLTTCTYTPSTADKTAGTVTLTLTASTIGACSSDSSTKTLTIYTTPTITGTTPATRTGVGTVNLGATASVGTLYWYAAAIGGTSLGFGTTFTTPTLSATTTYYVEAINGVCSSATRTAVVATVNYPAMNVKGNAVVITNGSVSPLTTNWTDFGSTNMTRTFTIGNTGLGVLSIASVSITGVNASDFSVTTAPGSSVATSSSTTFVVTFSPSAAGVRDAVISISNNDTANNPYTFAIRGTGVIQGITIQGNSTTIANGSVTPTTANWTDFGSSTATRTFTIINSGNMPLTTGTITITGTNASDFTVTTAPAATIAAYGTTTFIVTFAPSAINSRTATISIVNNDSVKNPYIFAIQGFGVIPVINIQGNATNITNGATTTTTTNWTDFSTVTVTRTFTIFNNGNLPLSLGAITFSGANPTDFSVTTAPAASVSAFSTTTFVVTFAPGVVGARNAIISIVNNDALRNPYTFKVSGTGVVQGITVLGNAVSIANNAATATTTNWTDFSNVTYTRTFTITNTGNMTLTTGAITFTGTNATDFAVTSAPAATIAAFGSTTLTVTFTPGAIGTRTAKINIVNNDSTKTPFNYTLQGTGGTPNINIISQYSVTVTNGSAATKTNQTDFGSVNIEGGTVIANFTVQNTGTGALSLGAATFTGTNATDFALLSAPSATIGAGSTSKFKISFTPTVKGTKAATFSMVTNVSGKNPYTFGLAGTGVQTYQDTDSDGITDNKDTDDDNDGIIDVKEQTDGLNFPLTSLVEYTFLNETFGTGTTKGPININTPGASCSYCYEDGYGSACDASVTLEDGEYCVNYKITGSVSSDPENIHGDLAWYDGLDHTPSDTDGRMAVFNASFAAGTFYETQIDGVIPNVPISYSFYVLNIMRQSNFSGSILPNITVEFVDLSNNLLSSFNTGYIGRCSATSTDNTCSTSNWLQFSTSVNLGNITSFIVRFKNNSTGGGGNDLAIDDINIKQNYIDTDGDGIANIFDLDDDNDGIPDIEEASFKVYSNGLSRMDLSSSATWVDANGNGLHDNIDAMISGGSYNIADTDGDSVPNYLDLDSDNDSLFDVDESNVLNGDGDINGDGRGDLVDTDRDGILDLYDNNTGFGTTIRAYAQDTDGNSVPNYIQLDSDNDGTKDINTYLYGSLDTSGDGTIDGSTDVDKDGILDTFDTNTSVIGSPRDLNRKLELEFDGRNDYGQDTAILGGLANASLMAWVDLNSGFSADGVVVGQDKFQIRITSSKYLEVVVNSTTLTYNTTALSTSRWYNVGAVYGGGFLKLYLNGEMVKSVALSGNIATDASLLTIGRNPLTAAKYFKGKIDEVRVFNVALTDSQFQRMVYQEIDNTAAQVRGTIVPKDISSLPYSNLLRYYRMDAYKDDIVDNYTTGSVDVSTGMKIYNNKYIYVQQAPMPFITQRTGSFATAVEDTTNDIRGLDIMDQDWSIVQVKHNVTEPSNNVDLGMFVDSGVTISMNNDNKIQNDWYLKLDGKIDLVGKSQLIQTINSDLDRTSAGSIERDQQGQANKFNYNYWSSPVGSINTSTNNSIFSVNDILRDGTDPSNIYNINWTSAYNGSPTTPVTLSSYWIFKFQNVTPLYANWAAVGPTGTLLAGQGFTLKGSGSAAASQNYTFVGKPNNGSITSPIAANNANLSGNPYASALDANAFIIANSASTTGTLYFWEHFATNTSHNLIDYQGGYSVRTLVGGTPPVAPSGISGLGSSAKTPGRYIPVGQGFLVYGSSAGGTITFDNSQRAFIKETDVNSNTLFRNANAGPIASSPFDNREDSTGPEDTFAKIRLGFNANGFHRQLLLGFMNELATESFDNGYDARQIDTQPNEMTFIIPGAKLAIQGVGHFNSDSIYPLGVKSGANGIVKFTLDGTENMESNQEIYIYDSVTQEYHDIRNEAYEVSLPVGSIDDRFSLRFRNASILATGHFEPTDQIVSNFTNSDNTFTIKNNELNLNVETVTMFNILGQSINTWDVKNDDQTKIQIPVKNVSTGTYIMKLHTTKGDISKKIIVK
jgi:hypothetical protein